MRKHPLSFWASCLGLSIAIAATAAAQPATLYTPGSSFNFNDSIVSATVFHWFAGPDSGQRIGPWRPIEGRENWSGEVPFWKDQIKDIMDANVDLMYVHMIPLNAPNTHEQIRLNLFQAANELRSQGYNVPRIAPFLDPPITWSIRPPIDLATQAGKDDFVEQYEHFFQQYYSVNTDPYATEYLGVMKNYPGNTIERIMLNTWHLSTEARDAQGNIIVPERIHNRASLTRADVESRLADEFAAQHPEFANGVYQVATALNPGIQMPFADERIAQFETHNYFHAVEYNPPGPNNTIRTAQLKAGYWDQNLAEREPGAFIPRNGGSHFDGAWQQANANSLTRVNIESWNEYDEGSGIYAGDTGPPYISEFNTSGNTDVWSSTNNPRQYIDASSAGAREFNDGTDPNPLNARVLDRDADILWHDFPNQMYAGSTLNVKVIVRNEGDFEWTAAQDYKFGQQEFLPTETVFGAGRFLMDDTQNEIPKFGGIFRGRPMMFDINIVAPGNTGNYDTHWSMLQELITWFGEVLTVPIEVVPPLHGDANMDGDVDLADLGILATFYGTESGADWSMADFDSNHNVNLADLGLLTGNYGAGESQAMADFEALMVPEPSIGAALIGLLALRRRTRQSR